MFLVRVLLVGAVMAGLIAMHVLAHPDGGTGHGAVAHPASTGQGVDHIPAMGVEAAQRETPPVAASMVTANPDPADHGMSMAECILFLALGMTLLAALLLALRAAPRLSLLPRRRRTPLECRRGPPPSRSLRLLLCVLRV